jgi:hypothetical protein
VASSPNGSYAGRHTKLHIIFLRPAFLLRRGFYAPAPLGEIAPIWLPYTSFRAQERSHVKVRRPVLYSCRGGTVPPIMPTLNSSTRSYTSPYKRTSSLRCCIWCRPYQVLSSRILPPWGWPMLALAATNFYFSARISVLSDELLSRTLQQPVGQWFDVLGFQTVSAELQLRGEPALAENSK